MFCLLSFRPLDVSPREVLRSACLSVCLSVRERILKSQLYYMLNCYGFIVDLLMSIAFSTFRCCNFLRIVTWPRPKTQDQGQDRPLQYVTYFLTSRFHVIRHIPRRLLQRALDSAIPTATACRKLQTH